jgi:ssRNA-specific RNase YbeY (16S rRNA maturation enzyme)
MANNNRGPDRAETADEAKARRVAEVRRIVADEIPRRSDQVTLAFVRKDFVQAITAQYRKSK